MNRFCLPALLLLSAWAVQAEDYGCGAIVIAENQYGKTDSSVLHLNTSGSGEWNYGIFASANPDKALGGTACSAAYAGENLVVVCKDARASASSPLGGIVTSMNGHTMALNWQNPQLDPSGLRASGRGVLPIGNGKIYVSSSNGIWVLNSSSGATIKQIEGTENPFGVDDKPVADPTSTLYIGQTGTMVAAASKVFAAHQSKGLLVIDPSADKLTETISMDEVAEGAGIGSIVKASDGNLYFSITDRTDGYGISLPKLLKVNPADLSRSIVELPDNMFGPATSWAAWTPDTFCASADGYLFWTGADDNWYANYLLYRYEIATGTTSLLIDFNDNEDGWKICTPSMRVNPADNLLYTTLFKDYASKSYTVRSFTEEGTEVASYPMKDAYWFSGIILFPESEMAGIDVVKTDASAVSPLQASYAGGVLRISAPAGAEVAVVADLSGRIIATIPLCEGSGSLSCPLPCGIYIASAGGAAAKFAVNR